MFEVGFTEIILIFGIALLVLGPARLPKLAADLGRWAGRARSMARQLRTQLEQEVHFDPLAQNPTPGSAGTTPAAAAAAALVNTPSPDPQTAHPDRSTDLPETPVVAPEDPSARAAPLQSAPEGAPAPDPAPAPRQDGQ